MKSYFLLGVLLTFCFFVSAQKQLDSIYGYQYKNNLWELTQSRTFKYELNTSSETFSSFDLSNNRFEPSNYYFFTYSPSCDDQLIQRDNYSYTNGVLQKNISIFYDRNTDCEIEFQRTVRFDGVTTLYYEYLDIDAYGSARHIKYYKNGVNNTLVLDFEDFHTYQYTGAGKTRTITTNRKRNGVTSPYSMTEYKYTGNGKIENFLSYFYDNPSSQFKKSLELSYIYNPTVEVLNTITYNNPTSSPELIRIDSSYLDSDKDVTTVTTWAPIGGNFASSFRSDYYYTKSSSTDNENIPNIKVKISSPTTEQINFNIENPDQKKLEMVIFDIMGRKIVQKSYEGVDVIDDILPGFLGFKVFTIFHSGKVIYSKILSI
jgi:hypothetical protein